MEQRHRKCKPQYTMCTIRRYCYMQQRCGWALRERKAKYKWDEILESNNGKDKERQNQLCTHHRLAQDGEYI
jgi:hypothetical protein